MKTYSALCLALLSVGSDNAAQASFIEDDSLFQAQTIELSSGYSWSPSNASDLNFIMGSDETVCGSGINAASSGPHASYTPPLPEIVVGVNYQFDLQDLARVTAPICKVEAYNKQTPVRNIGYYLEVPVNGDVGQEIIYKITGVSDVNMTLKARCGGFYAIDHGDKFVIDKRRVNTYGCEKMQIVLRTHYALPRSLHLNVALLETY